MKSFYLRKSRSFRREHAFFCSLLQWRDSRPHQDFFPFVFFPPKSSDDCCESSTPLKVVVFVEAWPYQDTYTAHWRLMMVNHIKKGDDNMVKGLEWRNQQGQRGQNHEPATEKKCPRKKSEVC